jgi:hypothetical protein
MTFFNATEVAPSTFGRDPLPKGTYRVQISKIEELVSKNSGNKYIKVEYTVIDGEYETRKHWQNINFWHPKPDVQKRARAEFSSLCRATGVLTPNGLGDLENRTLALSLGLRKNDSDEPENTITKMEPDAGPGAIAAPRAAAAQPTAGKWGAQRPAA